MGAILFLNLFSFTVNLFLFYIIKVSWGYKEEEDKCLSFVLLYTVLKVVCHFCNLHNFWVMLQKFLKDLKYLWWRRSYDFPHFTRNFQVFYKIPDFKTWKKDQDKFPTFSRFFNTVGDLRENKKENILLVTIWNGI